MKKWLRGVSYSIGFECMSPKEAKRIIFPVVHPYFGHLYFKRLNMDYINQSFPKCGKSAGILNGTIVRHKTKHIYSEFTYEIENLSDSEL